MLVNSSRRFISQYKITKIFNPSSVANLPHLQPGDETKNLTPESARVRLSAMEVAFFRDHITNFVGKVEAVGPKVNSLKVNDVVVNLKTKGWGPYRQVVDANEKSFITFNSSITPEAAALSSYWVAAMQLVRGFANLKEGDFIVQNGADNPIGIAVIEYARIMNIRTINVVDTVNLPDPQETLSLLKSLDFENYVIPTALANSFEFDTILSELPKAKLAINYANNLKLQPLFGKFPQRRVPSELRKTLNKLDEEELLYLRSSEALTKILDPKGTMVTYGYGDENVPNVNVAQYHPSLTHSFFDFDQWVSSLPRDVAHDKYQKVARILENTNFGLFLYRHKPENFHEAVERSKYPLHGVRTNVVSFKN